MQKKTNGKTRIFFALPLCMQVRKYLPDIEIFLRKLGFLGCAFFALDSMTTFCEVKIKIPRHTTQWGMCKKNEMTALNFETRDQKSLKMQKSKSKC